MTRPIDGDERLVRELETFEIEQGPRPSEPYSADDDRPCFYDARFRRLRRYDLSLKYWMKARRQAGLF